ncbi:hypothetical protein CsSME_00003831 [Camellia sinensis var. sinensis]|uniref:putative B3 domain-containing protein At5g66980 n=1 Tax=Camellia sinensis TaxID=4442 RepID=UPI001035A3B3|nr:putative B3 domain-containing protein At5g66980 [Camellia sinensis]
MAKRHCGRKASYFYEFFKVYLPDQSSQSLRVPPAFVKQLNGPIPNNAILKDLGGKFWHVEIEEAENGIYFKNGWQRFVNDNSLEFGNFLVFRYKGHSLFHVKIFRENGCMKEEALTFEKTAVSVEIEEESEEEDTCSEPIHNCKRKYSKIGRKRSENYEGKSERLECEARSEGITKGTLRLKVPRAIQGDDRALETASKFVSEFPFFKVVMAPAYINGGLMNIPATFLKSYMEEDRQSVTLLVSDKPDKSWPVKLIRFKETTCKLSQGWLKFCRENTLKTRDVCVFELVERNDFVLKVSILRCLD